MEITTFTGIGNFFFKIYKLITTYRVLDIGFEKVTIFPTMEKTYRITLKNIGGKSITIDSVMIYVPNVNKTIYNAHLQYPELLLVHNRKLDCGEVYEYTLKPNQLETLNTLLKVNERDEKAAFTIEVKDYQGHKFLQEIDYKNG